MCQSLYVATIHKIKKSVMQEEATRSTVNEYFEQVYEGVDPVSIASLFSENVDFFIPGNVDLVPWIGRRKGRDGIANFIKDLSELTEPISFNIHSTVVEGEKAVALGHLKTRVKRTGKVIDTGFAFEFTVKDSLITRFRMYEDSFAVAQAVTYG